MNKYKFQAMGIGVDSGTIAIMDVKNCEVSEYEDEGYTFKALNGIYSVKWKIGDSWNGVVAGKGKLIVSTGKIVVVDPCYVIRDENWHHLLNSTDYLRDPPEGWVILDKHGGDGCFNVDVQLTEMKPNEREEVWQNPLPIKAMRRVH